MSDFEFTDETRHAVAVLLGMKDSEVIAAVEVDEGLVVRTFDDTTLILVDDDNPDAAGRSGVMLLTQPAPTYGGSFPVYSARAGRIRTWEELHDLEDATLIDLGVDPDSLPDGDRPQPLHEQASVEALATQPGPGYVAGEPVPEARTEDPPVGDQQASAPNADTGARNVTDTARPADPGTVVPEGNARTILAWAGDDSARLRQVIDAERAKPSPRTSLIAQAEDRLAGVGS